jgi:hypothetical protein
LWATRGALKAEAKKLAPIHYLLNPPETLNLGTSNSHQKSIDFTKARVAHLLTDYKFLYGEFNGVRHGWLFTLD